MLLRKSNILDSAILRARYLPNKWIQKELLCTSCGLVKVYRRIKLEQVKDKGFGGMNRLWTNDQRGGPARRLLINSSFSSTIDWFSANHGRPADERPLPAPTHDFETVCIEPA